MADDRRDARADGSERGLEDYPRPSVAVDSAVLVVDAHSAELGVLQHRRAGRSHRGAWALPGTFLHPGETLADAVLRSLDEKVGLRGTQPQQLHVFDAPDRDERGWVLSVAHVVLLLAEDVDRVVAGRSDDLRVVPVDEVAGLPFDHDEIVRLAVDRVRRDYAVQPDPAGLLGERFTFAALRALHDAVAPQPGPGETRPSVDTFRRYMAGRGLIEPTGEFARKEPGAMGKPAELYRRSSDALDVTDVLGIRPVRKDRNRGERVVENAGPVGSFAELTDHDVASALQHLVDDVGSRLPLTLTATPNYVAVRPVGSTRVAAYVKPRTISIGLDPGEAVDLAAEWPQVRLERTSAATHHVHVPAADLVDARLRQVALDALGRALLRAAS